MAGILALAKYGVLVGVLSIGALLPSAQVQPTAKVKIGVESGLVVSAAGSIWTTDLVLGRVVRVDAAKNAVTKLCSFVGWPLLSDGRLRVRGGGGMTLNHAGGSLVP